MLSIILLLLVTSSAFGAPVVNVENVLANAFGDGVSNGKSVSGASSAYATVFDKGDINNYFANKNLQLPSFVNFGDVARQVATAAQGNIAVTKLTEVVPGSAELINAVAVGNQADIKENLRKYVETAIFSLIDRIVQLSQNPSLARFPIGFPDPCSAGARDEKFQGIWDAILANTKNSEMMKQQYCAIKNLFQAFTISGKSFGSAPTAAVLEPLQVVFQNSFGPFTEFIKSIGTPNVADAAAIAKGAITQAVAAY